MRKYFSFLLGIFLGGFLLLGGCNLKQANKTTSLSTGNVEKKVTVNVSSGNKVANQDTNNYDFSFPVILTTDIKQPDINKNLEKLSSKNGKVTVYIDSGCQNYPVCDKTTILNRLVYLGIKSGDVVFEILKQNIDIYLPAVVIPNSVAQKLVKNNPQVAQILGRFFKKVGNNYVAVMGNWEHGKENLCNDQKDNDGDGLIDEKDPDCNKKIAVLYDSLTPQVGQMLNFYKTQLYGYSVTGIQADTNLGKKIIDEIEEAIKNNSLTGSNRIVILNDSTYKYAVLQKPIVKINKVDKPKAYLYVMSHCPFGLQAEKSFLEVMKKLGKYADVQIKFVPYTMHGYEESVDNITQYCIYKEYPDKFQDYMKCFLGSGKRDECLKKIGLSKNDKKFKECFDETAKKVDLNGIKKQLDSGNRFPRFNLDAESAEKAGVQGSPTFVLNGQKIEGIKRSARAYAKEICKAFKNPPEICKHLDQFSDTVYDPGYGWTSGGQNVGNASCGGN